MGGPNAINDYGSRQPVRRTRIYAMRKPINTNPNKADVQCVIPPLAYRDTSMACTMLFHTATPSLEYGEPLTH
jgi:hypothetical protein